MIERWLVAALTLGLTAPAVASTRSLAPAPESPLTLPADTPMPGLLASDSIWIARGARVPCAHSSADDTGVASFSFTLTDRGNQACDFVYDFELAAGSLGKGMDDLVGRHGADCHPDRPLGPHGFVYSWHDETRAEDRNGLRKELLSFLLRVTPVDGAGRRGQAGLFHILHDGLPDPAVRNRSCPVTTPAAPAPALEEEAAGGCAIGGRRGPPASCVFLLLTALLGRLRRRSL
jgi:hypothetical protein